MGIEIERKFLVNDTSWQAVADEGTLCRQGYLLSGEGKVLRVRRMGEVAYLTLKGPTHGISRAEFEYEIPVSDAEELLSWCSEQVVKTRYRVALCGLVWEIDCFSGANDGLVLAEVELESEEQSFVRPDWLGEEVSGDARYYNASLARSPFSLWGRRAT